MRRSKLEIRLDILKALAHGPLKITHIAYKTAINCKDLRQSLEFLVKQNLVEEKAAGKKKTLYFITERGITVLKNLKQLETLLQVSYSSAEAESLQL
jgi:predicted transcriptional regulator